MGRIAGTTGLPLAALTPSVPPRYVPLVKATRTKALTTAQPGSIPKGHPYGSELFNQKLAVQSIEPTPPLGGNHTRTVAKNGLLLHRNKRCQKIMRRFACLN